MFTAENNDRIRRLFAPVPPNALDAIEDTLGQRVVDELRDDLCLCSNDTVEAWDAMVAYITATEKLEKVD